MRPVHRPNHIYLSTPPTAQAPLLTQRAQSPNSAKLPPWETLDSTGGTGSSLDSLHPSPVPEQTAIKCGQGLAAHFFAVIATPTTAAARFVPYPYPNATPNSSQPSPIRSSLSADLSPSSTADISHDSNLTPVWLPLESYPQIQLTPGRSLLLIARDLPAHLQGVWCSGQHQDYLVYPQIYRSRQSWGSSRQSLQNQAACMQYPVPTETTRSITAERSARLNSQTSLEVEATNRYGQQIR